mmetsp:Transcript_89884/g.214772  ORF Transcript_89884/g.214772 Transcript_89884/m.214772 type:complete len:110 (+) Transcript_89884:358-687(+)
MSSRESTVTASKSFVGSSRIRTFGFCTSTRSSCSRRFSPPESMPTCVLHRLWAKLMARSIAARLPSMDIEASFSRMPVSPWLVAAIAISATTSMTRCFGSGHCGGSCER